MEKDSEGKMEISSKHDVMRVTSFFSVKKRTFFLKSLWGKTNFSINSKLRHFAGPSHKDVNRIP